MRSGTDMREVFAVVAYDNDGEREELAHFDDFDKAEDFYFMCIEGDDRDDPCEYIIESTSIAE
jgi:hypothetical protein